MNHKTILVTGASRGIGKAIALTYARNGWDVVITCLRREEELKKTQREIEALGVSCLAWMGDAGDFESCSRLFDAIRERFGSLDVLVNNAGISYIGPVPGYDAGRVEPHSQYQPDLRLQLLPPRRSDDGVTQIGTHSQYFLRLGHLRRFLRSRLFCHQRRHQRHDARPREGTCAEQHPGQRDRLRRY